MTAFIIDILKILLPVFYFLLVGTYGRAFFSDIKWAQRIKTPLLAFIIALHLTYLLLRAVAFSHPPVTNLFEIFSVLAFSVALTYLVIELRAQHAETGYFILNIAFFFQLASSLFIKDSPQVPEILRSLFFGLHVTAALLGYAAVTIAGSYGFLYLMLYHEMKATRFGVIYKKLPTLETIERMAVTAIRLAFVILGCAITFGIIWLHHVYANIYSYDPKLIGTVIIWILYGFLAVAPAVRNFKGRKMMIVAILGFVVAIFSMTVVNIFFSGFHKFY
ncbi:MAG: cytochrome c biogenesis protein CcsA [Bacteroidota bacterium]